MKPLVWFASGAVFSAALCSAIFSANRSAEIASVNSSVSGSPRRDRGHHDTEGQDRTGSKRGERAAPVDRGEGKGIRSISILEEFAKVNPELLSRLNLRLFDIHGNPILENWDLLGLGPDDAARVHEKLSGVVSSIKAAESGRHQVISSTDGEVQIALEGGTPEEAQQRRRELNEVFAVLFDTKLADVMTDQFIDAIRDLRSYTAHHETSIFSGIPDRWAHLFQMDP